jgi:hypothetical protein
LDDVKPGMFVQIATVDGVAVRVDAKRPRPW